MSWSLIFNEKQVYDFLESTVSFYPLNTNSAISKENTSSGTMIDSEIIDEKEITYDLLFKPNSNPSLFIYAYSSKSKKFEQIDDIKQNRWSYCIVENPSMKVVEYFNCDTSEWDTI